MSTDEFDLTFTDGYVTPGRRKNNWTATASPGATDDASDQYEVGSLWIDVSADTAWVCVDSTTSAAVWNQIDAAGGGGAPDDADYLVGTADGDLSNEIVVGTSPGGELGGTWDNPTVDATHSGSTHAAAQAAAEATAAAALSGHTADSDDAHDASAISVLDAGGNFTATDVEAALAELAAGGGGALGDLSDVTITAAAEGDLIRYDGSAWVDTTLRPEPMIDSAGDVMTDGALNPMMHEVAW